MSAPLRLALPDDLPAITALERRVFGAAAWSATSLETAQRDRPELFFVAEAPGSTEIVGHALGGLASDVGEVLELAVSPEARRSGLGRALLGALEGALCAMGARELWLEVRADNEAALALYQRQGYAMTGRRRRYYADGTDAVLMSRTP